LIQLRAWQEPAAPCCVRAWQRQAIYPLLVDEIELKPEKSLEEMEIEENSEEEDEEDEVHNATNTIESVNERKYFIFAFFFLLLNK